MNWRTERDKQKEEDNESRQMRKKGEDETMKDGNKQQKRGESKTTTEAMKGGFYYLRKYLKFLCRMPLIGWGSPCCHGNERKRRTHTIKTPVCVCVSPPTHCSHPSIYSSQVRLTFISRSVCFHHPVVTAAIIIHRRGHGAPASGRGASILILSNPGKHSNCGGAGVRRWRERGVESCCWNWCLNVNFSWT